DFLERYLPAQPGQIETINGLPLGKHSGLMYYTLGQRQGIGVGGTKDHAEAPWYVVDKDMQRNVLIVAQGNENEHLYSTNLSAKTPSWINHRHPSLPLTCAAKIRYRQADQACQVNHCDPQSVTVSFSRPQRAVTPGQYIVFYEGDVCLGGAIIEKFFRQAAAA
ncbi:MAG: aminomethyltransferase beta-barrel domain-containing protein, partial [Pseudohongiellaceae bacterium]